MASGDVVDINDSEYVASGVEIGAAWNLSPWVPSEFTSLDAVDADGRPSAAAPIGAGGYPAAPTIQTSPQEFPVILTDSVSEKDEV